MAGRGVDIKLGDGVIDLGGLYVLGTERHEARRIDNQLRGRSGRQGDPGETRFYLSAQDDLVRLFAGDRIHGIMVEGLLVGLIGAVAAVVLLHAEPGQHGRDPLAGELAHQVVFERQEEPRAARVPLPPRAAAELVVDAA